MNFEPVFSSRILWVDLAKVVGLVAILTIHVSSSYLMDYNVMAPYWVMGVFFESLARFGIILFVMVSGFLLFKKSYEIKEFFSKRFNRVLVPFIFWNLIYIFIKIKFQNLLAGDYSLFNICHFIVGGFLDPRIITVQFWFVYMIFALYIVAPVLSSWIRNANDKEMEYFLVVWLGILIINFCNIKFLLVEYLTFFTGFVGYFVLGYYLAIKESKRLRSFKFGLALFLIGAVITFFGTILTSFCCGKMSFMFMQLGDLTPFTVMQASGMFIMIKNFSKEYLMKHKVLSQCIVKISLASYGVYLVNVLFINAMALFGLYSTKMIPFVNVPIFLVLTLIVSTLLVVIMSKISFLKKFSGVA